MDGTALAYHLVDLHFGHKSLGVWMSNHVWLCGLLGIGTIVFEAGFPIFVLVRKTNPWILLAGIGFHMGIMTTMHVGTFSWVAVAAYPVLLRPEVARRWYAVGSGWLASRRQLA